MLFSKKLIPLALSTLTLGIQVASLPFSSVGIFQDGIARESLDVAEDQKLRGIARKLTPGQREVTTEIEFKASTEDADAAIGSALYAADGTSLSIAELKGANAELKNLAASAGTDLAKKEQAKTIEEAAGKREEKKMATETSKIDSATRVQAKNTGETNGKQGEKRVAARTAETERQGKKTGETDGKQDDKKRAVDNADKGSAKKGQVKKTTDCDSAVKQALNKAQEQWGKKELEYQSNLKIAKTELDEKTNELEGLKAELVNMKNDMNALKKELTTAKKVASDYQTIQKTNASLKKELGAAQATGKQETEAYRKLEGKYATLEKKMKRISSNLEKEKQAYNLCSTKSEGIAKKCESSEKAMEELQDQNTKCQTESVEKANRVEALNQKLEKMTVDYDDMKLKLGNCTKPKKPVLRPLKAYVEVDASASHFIPAKDIDGDFSTAGSQLVQDGRVTIEDTKFSPKEAYFHMKCTATSSRDHKDHVYRNEEFVKRRVATSSPSSSPSSSPTTKSEKKKKYCENYYKPKLSEQKNLIKQRLQPEKEKITRVMVHGGPQRAMCEFSICVYDNCLLMSSTGRVHFGPFHREDPENVPRINGRVVGCDFDEDERKRKDGKIAVDKAYVRKTTGHKQFDDKDRRMGGEMCLGYLAGGVRITTIQLPSRGAKSFQYHIEVEPNLFAQLSLPWNDFTSVQVLDTYAFYSTSPGNT